MELEDSTGVLEECQIAAWDCGRFHNSVLGQLNLKIGYNLSGDFELGLDSDYKHLV
jgi:hypothetical protein